MMDDYQTRRRYRERKLTRNAFAERYQRRRAERFRAAQAAGSQPSLQQIADPEYLLRINARRKAHGGTAAGPDHVADSMLGPREEAAIYRAVAEEIRTGTYEPSEARHVPVPKPSGGFRLLSIRSIVFRTVSAALATVLGPFWERIFLPGSHGFRPGRGPWSMLLDMERIIAEEGRFVIVTDDIRKAFDTVPIAAIMDLHRRHLTDEPLLALVEKVLRGNSQENRVVGVDQGSAYSPLALNVLLHDVLDSMFSEEAANPPQLRYADNLVYLCRDVSEATAAISRARQLLLPYGMSLKGEDGEPVDLRREGQTVQILGYSVRWEKDRMQCSLGIGAWLNLKKKLSETHRCPNPTRMAQEVPRGWIGYYGPCFESKGEEADVKRILRIIAKDGFREVSRDRIERYVQSARDRWVIYRKRESSREIGAQGAVGASSSARCG